MAAAMYDTVHMRLERGLPALPPMLKGVIEHCSQTTGEVVVSGVLENMRVKLSGREVYIGGSLCKLLHGNNHQTLTRGDVAKALEKLSDALGASILPAKVTRLDVGACLLLTLSPASYFELLGDMPRFSRTENFMANGNGIYYTNNQRQLLFYDKVREMRSKQQRVPDELRSCSALRYELRYRRSVARQLRAVEVRAESLPDAAFFYQLVNQWEASYVRINKNSHASLMDGRLSGDVRELTAILAAEGMRTFGGSQCVLRSIDELYTSSTISGAQRGRCKRKIRELMRLPLSVSSNEALIELDAAIHAAAEYHRQG